jgi:hypothetical protein
MRRPDVGDVYEVYCKMTWLTMSLMLHRIQSPPPPRPSTIG